MPDELAIDAQGHSRIQQSDDPVRLEIEAALQSGATASTNWLQTAVGVPSNTWFSASTTSGSTWSAATTGNCLRFRIYGTTTP